MFSLCMICSGMLSPVGEISVTICGHLFHQRCLTEWVNRSSTCPQCQKAVTQTSIFPLYPKLSGNTEGNDASLLQICLDDAQMQINQHKAACKEKEDKLAEATALLKKNEEALHLYKVKVELLERRDELNVLKRENEALKISVNAAYTHLNAALDRLRSKESHIIALNEQVRELPVFIESISNLRNENETLKKCVISIKRRLDAARDYIENQRSRIVSLKQQLKMLPEPKNHEVVRLNGEIKTLMKNIQALDGILSFVKGKLASRVTTIISLKEKLKSAETDNNNECSKLKKRLITLKRDIINTLAVIKKKQTPAIPASPQATKCLKRKKDLEPQSAGISENKRAKDDIDRSENASDSSSDDSDSDASNDSDLELLDCYSHDPMRLYEAIIKKKLGTHCEGVTIKQEPKDE